MKGTISTWFLDDSRHFTHLLVNCNEVDANKLAEYLKSQVSGGLEVRKNYGVSRDGNSYGYSIRFDKERPTPEWVAEAVDHFRGPVNEGEKNNRSLVSSPSEKYSDESQNLGTFEHANGSLHQLVEELKASLSKSVEYSTELSAQLEVANKEKVLLQLEIETKSGATQNSQPLANTQGKKLQPCALLSKTFEALDEMASAFSDHDLLAPLRLRTLSLAAQCGRPLTIMVAGPFNSGKSTFLNCILGEEVLASSVTPSTSIPTTLCFGGSRTLTGKHLNGEIHVLDKERLKEFSTVSDDQFQPGNQLVELVVENPASVLEHATFIDSPGLHSVTNSHTLRTERTHDQVDGVIWVTSCAQSASAAEVADIAKFQGRLKPLIIANQVDLLGDEDERRKSLARMQRRLNLDLQSLAGLSASIALDGLVKGDQSIIQDSGWPEFLDILLYRFLPTRHAQRLSNVSAECLSLLDDLSSVLSIANSELEKLESNLSELRAAHGVAKQEQADYSDAISRCKSWLESVGSIPTRDAEWETWLVKGTENSMKVLSSVTRPMTIDEIHPSLRDKMLSQLDSLTRLSETALSGFEKLLPEAKAAELEYQRVLDEKEEQRKRKVEFEGRNSIYKGLCFRYRQRLEERDVQLRAEESSASSQIKKVTSDLKSSLSIASRFISEITDFLGAINEQLRNSLVRIESKIKDLDRNLGEAEAAVNSQIWARGTRNFFLWELRPNLLEAIAVDMASAKEMLA